MIERFQGASGRTSLLAALEEQSALRGLPGAVERLGEFVQLKDYAPGDALIEQDGVDRDIFFILSGTVNVAINGRLVAHRYAGQHVGEMALLDFSARRSAKVFASEETVCAVVAEADFRLIADAYSIVWQRLAKELAARLRQRGLIIRPPNPNPHVFIGSSSEALYIATEISEQLKKKKPYVVRLWSQDVFKASLTTIESLEAQLLDADFAVLVSSPDDWVISRWKRSSATRDNVVFELGLFMGALTRKRTFLLHPKDRNTKIPSDLAGVTLLKYEFNSAKPVSERLESVCMEISKIIDSDGSR